MSSPVFNQSLDAFCCKYLFSNRAVSAEDQAAFPHAAQRQNTELFEQLLLFDTVAFKVSGENLPLVILISQIGLKGVEQLIEEGSLRFVLWSQNIFSMVTDTPGVHPLAHGKMNSAAHSDPEKSVETGLAWLSNKIAGRRAKRLIQKVADLYDAQPDDLAANAVAMVHSAYQSGRLTKYGLDPADAPLDNVPSAKRQILLRCSSEMSEYKLLMDKNWTSLSNFSYFDLFSDSVKRLTEASAVTTGFQHLAKIEKIPDLTAIFPKGGVPLSAVPRIRSKRSSARFREWLASGVGETPTELASRYVDAVADSQGFFQRTSGKVVKSIAMTSVGAGVGAAIEGGLSGMAMGGLAGKAIEPLADLGLDLVDSFLLDGLLRGWTPRIFFSDIKKAKDA